MLGRTHGTQAAVWYAKYRSQLTPTIYQVCPLVRFLWRPSRPQSPAQSERGLESRHPDLRRRLPVTLATEHPWEPVRVQLDTDMSHLKDAGHHSTEVSRLKNLEHGCWKVEVGAPMLNGLCWLNFFLWFQLSDIYYFLQNVVSAKLQVRLLGPFFNSCRGRHLCVEDGSHASKQFPKSDLNTWVLLFAGTTWTPKACKPMAF